MALHRIFTDDPLPAGPAELTIGGEEAHHALRVKRVQTGDPVLVLNGRGRVAEGQVAGAAKRGREWELRVAVRRVIEADPLTPRIEVYSPLPKGPRLAEMIDGLSQVGAASWSPLETRRTLGEPRPARLERLDRTAAEASKQCGRPWRLEIGPGADLRGLLGSSGVIVADASGVNYTRTGVPSMRLLVGPEGGWTPDELEAARAAGTRVARFGPHSMRIETATVAAAAIILAVETGPAGP